MSASLSHRARVWVLVLLLAGAGLVLLAVWAFSPSGGEPKIVQPEEPVGRSEPVVAPVAEVTPTKPEPVEDKLAQPTPELAKAEPPTPAFIPAIPTEARPDGAVIDRRVLKSMKGLLNFVSGTMGTGTGTTTSK